MVVKVYISGISGNKEVKKRQQRVLMILDSKNVEYEVIDITEPGKEDEKEFMQTNSKTRDSKYPLPPQIFNEDNYCGDYENFDLANEVDELDEFLKITEFIDDENNDSLKKHNDNSSSREMSTDKDVLSEEQEEKKKSIIDDDEIVEDNEDDDKSLDIDEVKKDKVDENSSKNQDDKEEQEE